MASVEHVERALERLLPCALSLRATEAIEERLDALAVATEPGLAEPAATIPAPVKPWRRHPWRTGLGSAAALVAGGFAALWFWPQPLEQGRVVDLAPLAPSEDLELIREVDRLESAVDEGTLADEEGGVHRVLRYRVVGEAYVRGNNGEVVRVVEPRDEVVLVPVTAF
jgi:hypothetical protein